MWIYIVKHKSNGTLDHYMDKTMTKGCTQTYVIDYYEAFTSPKNMNDVQIL